MFWQPKVENWEKRLRAANLVVADRTPDFQKMSNFTQIHTQAIKFIDIFHLIINLHQYNNI